MPIQRDAVTTARWNCIGYNLAVVLTKHKSCGLFYVICGQFFVGYKRNKLNCYKTYSHDIYHGNLISCTKFPVFKKNKACKIS